ncbi:MAG: ATP-binding protein [Acidimicrobiales bacterium]
MTDNGDVTQGSVLLTAALDGVPEAVVICDSAGAVVFENASAHKVLSSRPSDALLVQAVDELVAEALGGAEPYRRVELLSPSRRTLAVRAFPVTSPPEGAVAVIEDISDRLRLEAVRRDFVANVSHELKTPTGAIALLAETIEGETDPDVVSRLVERLGAEADRLSRTIDDLLDLSRIEANESSADDDVDIAALIDEAVAPLLESAESLKVVVSPAAVDVGLRVRGSRRDLLSAVSNLVDNAIKYSEAGGAVHVEAHRTHRGVEISVADHGIGIPSRDLSRIFERFYRVDRARSRSTGGTGLGLSIVRHVATNHGGRVKVRSVEGEGSTFTLILPDATASLPL